jgi:uncharacterized protein (TIGR02266 family)
MMSTTAADAEDTERQLRRTGELIQSAIDVLREEITDGGAMARAVERLARVSRALVLGTMTPENTGTSVSSVHGALSHVLAIGRAIREGLAPRGQQCLETLARAQTILYPIARAHGIAASTPPKEAAAEENPAGSERRISPRVDLDAEVSFEGENNFYQGFSEDVSDGGLFVATYQLSPVGTQFDLEFTLPTGHIVRTRAEVRWLRDPRNESDDAPPGMGLRFLQLLPEDARAINEFVQARSPIFYDD